MQSGSCCGSMKSWKKFVQAAGYLPKESLGKVELATFAKHEWNFSGEHRMKRGQR
jgi:hypothetical protein